MLTIIPLVNSCYDDGNLKDDINDLNSKYSSLENRIAALETQVKERNSEISSIQTIISNLEKNVYVSKVETIENGYKIYFTDNTIATIHDGKDGKNGENGIDGVDGQNAPIIGVAKDTDNIYYWTITTNGNTTWLLDNGKKLRVTGKDGENGHTPIIEIGSDNYWYIDGVKTNVKASGEDGMDGITPSISISPDGYWVINGIKSSIKAKGENGTNGEDGKDGLNGKDGITPLLKIDTEGYWTISYDNGKIYNRILDSNNSPVSAIGKDGENGQDGKDGVDGVDGQTPEIAIKQDSDGIYYWTKDGQWLTDQQGKKIKANGIDGENGKDAIAPKLKIENGRWLLSTDEGKSWVDIGQATGNNGKDGKDGDSFFQSVTQNQNEITLILQNGTIITIPIYKNLNINFPNGFNYTLPNTNEIAIDFTLDGTDENTFVEIITSHDFINEYAKDSKSRWSTHLSYNQQGGSIKIQGDNFYSFTQKITVIVANNNQTIARQLFIEYPTTIASKIPDVTINMEGTAIPINVASNKDYYGYLVEISEEAQNWCTFSQENDYILIHATPNNTSKKRSATITITAGIKDKKSAQFTITQRAENKFEIGDYYNINEDQGIIIEITDDGLHGVILSLDEGISQGSQWKNQANTWITNKGYNWKHIRLKDLQTIYNNPNKLLLLNYYGSPIIEGTYSNSDDKYFNMKTGEYSDFYYGEKVITRAIKTF